MNDASGSSAPVPVPPSRIDVFLKPGEYFVGDATHRIRTLLGSCVSVTLWSRLHRVGAMSHSLLAERGSAARGPQELDARYGDEALYLMLDELARADVHPAQCQAKVFGGGNMFPGHVASGVMAVGRRNGEAARQQLQAHGIEIVSESLFGTGHRQIIFDVSSGHVWSRQIGLGADPASSSS